MKQIYIHFRNKLGDKKKFLLRLVEQKKKPTATVTRLDRKVNKGELGISASFQYQLRKLALQWAHYFKMEGIGVNFWRFAILFMSYKNQDFHSCKNFTS